MESGNNEADALRQVILATELRLEKLKEELAEVEKRGSPSGRTEGSDELESLKDSKWPLTPEEYLRYGRQMIVPIIGIQGQHFNTTIKAHHKTNYSRSATLTCHIRSHSWSWRIRLPSCCIYRRFRCENSRNSRR